MNKKTKTKQIFQYGLSKRIIEKMILYSSNENDLVCDTFLDGFATTKVAIDLTDILLVSK